MEKVKVKKRRVYGPGEILLAGHFIPPGRPDFVSAVLDSDVVL